MSLDVERIRGAFPGRRIEYYDRVDSTMNVAARLAAEDASRTAWDLPRRLTVLAGEQTAGQGRHGHTWHSAPGTGIYCSIVLPPAPVLTLALGLATAEAIREAAGISCDLRWPNDLMLNGKKVVGIMVQAVGDYAIAGIGINVSQTSFPPELEREATSLALASGRPMPAQEDIVIALLRSVDAFAEADKESVLRLFTEASSYARGRRVIVDQAGGRVEGTTAGLDPSGFLIVHRDDGTDTLILAGGVRAAGS